MHARRSFDRTSRTRIASLVALSLFVAACQSTDEPDACQRARDHAIGLRVADAPAADRESHRRALRQADGDSFVSSCRSSMTAAQVRCVLAAADSPAVTACLSTSTSK